VLPTALVGVIVQTVLGIGLGLRFCVFVAMVANSGLYTGLYTGVQAKNFLFDLYKACTAAVQARMNGNER